MKLTTDPEKQLKYMTETPIPKLIASLALPTIVSMVITSAYNLADTYFVSQLGTSAAGAVGIAFSLMAVIQAVGFTLGMGSGGLISRYLGEKKNGEAGEAASTAFFTALVVGVLFMASGLIFLHPLMRALGATETILPYAKDYASYILLGTPIMCATFVMNNDLRAEGKATLSMAGIAVGCLLNIGLDPLFIFTFGMGISGAAIATVLSQCVSFLILLASYLRGRTIAGISPRGVSRHFAMYRDILKTGAPSFFRQGLASLATIALNVTAAVYGDAAVAAMSIVGRAFFLILSVLIGFGQGFQPVAGYNFGAKRYARLKQGFWFCVGTGSVGLLVLGALGFALAPQIMTAFRRDDPEVIAIGSMAFRAQCAIMPIQAFIVISNMLFQSIGRQRQASYISILRQGLCFLPIILILPRFTGLWGVQFSQPIADCASFLLCIPIVLRFMRELNVAISEGAKAENPQAAPRAEENLQPPITK